MIGRIVQCRWAGGIVALLLAGCSGSDGIGPDQEGSRTSERLIGEGFEHWLRRDLDRARDCFERAIRLDPDSGQVHYRLAMVYGDNFTDPVRALYHFDRFLELDPESHLAPQVEAQRTACLEAVCREAGSSPIPSETTDLVDQLMLQIQTLTASNRVLRLLADTGVPSGVVPVPGPSDPPDSDAPRGTNPGRTPPGNPEPRQQPTLPEFTFYEVRPYDTLFRIAQRYGLTLQELQAANPGVRPPSLQPGQKIKIPRRRPR